MDARLSPVVAAMVAAATLFLAACQPGENAGAGKRVEARWVDRQLLFVGDARLGTVRVYHLRAAPLLVGEMRAAGRDAIRDILVDATAGRVWVLGDGAVYLHDARSFALVRRIPAVGAGAMRLALGDDGAPLLVAGDGALLARIDPASLSVERQLVAGVRAYGGQ